MTTIAAIPPSPSSPPSSPSPPSPSPNGEDGGNGGNGGYGGHELERFFASRPLSSSGEAHRLIWDLASTIRGHYPNEGHAPAEALRLLRAWYDKGCSNTDKSWGEVRASFLDAWRRYDPAKSDFAQAVASADARDCPQVFREMFPGTRDEHTRRLITLCIELQERAGHASFFLSQKEAAQALGVSRETVGRLLRSLHSPYGPLTLTRRGSYAEGRANEYRWINHEAEGCA